MSNVPFTNKLFTILLILTVVASVILGLDKHSNLNSQHSVSDPEVLSNPSEKKIESSPSKTTVPSTNLILYKTTATFEQYQPKYTMVTIDPSNYGDRYGNDVYGNSLNNSPLVVLHETTNSITSAIETFKTPHVNDSNQVSYHTLISLDGTIVYLLPSGKRAFGAGNSAFKSSEGIETVKTNLNLPSSVNNFAYHISLETPLDGWGSQSQYHSGYTDSQYKSLAWLIAQSNIPDERITTHKDVDLSGNRFDPRSFDFDKFWQILHTYRQPIVEQMSAE